MHSPGAERPADSSDGQPRFGPSQLADQLRRSPLSASYALVLLATTVLLHAVADDQSTLRWASTNVDNLATHPLRAFVMSALFLPSEVWLPSAAAIAVTMAQLERRYGWRAVLAVFVAAHVGATLVTEGAVAVGMSLNLLPAALSSQLDVGASYGLWASAGAAMLLLPLGWRRLALAGAGLAVLVPLVVDPDMTTVGHVLSLAIGLAFWPVLRATQNAQPEHSSPPVLASANVPS